MLVDIERADTLTAGEWLRFQARLHTRLCACERLHRQVLREIDDLTASGDTATPGRLEARRAFADRVGLLVEKTRESLERLAADEPACERQRRRAWLR